MDKQFLSIIAGLSLLLASCAQVGTISGGEKDIHSPGIVENGMQPPNGSTQFQDSQIQLTFDEYIKLNNPNESIVITPADAKVTAEIRKKSVILTLTGNLKPETTYAIYLNGTVQDITESNDSLIQYVFSTGNYIDTITYSGKVADAYTYAPLKGVLVGLYTVGDSSFFRKPAYFSQTDAQGNFTCSYIKPGTYKVVAFEDQNKDLIRQPTERIGFKQESILLDSAYTDSLPMRLYTPAQAAIVRSISFNGPALLTLGSNSNLKDAELYLDGTRITSPAYQHTSDSLSVLIDPEDRSELTIVAKTTAFTDTVSLRLSETDRKRNVSFQTNLRNNSLLPNENLQFRFSDYITGFDSTKFQLLKADSIAIPFSVKITGENILEVAFDKTDNKVLKLNLLQNAITFRKSALFNSATLDINNPPLREYGTMVLTAGGFPEYAIIEVLQGNKVVRSFSSKDLPEKYTIGLLEANTYTFRVILDQNHNGRWDGGDFDKDLQPEEILFFTQGVKVRANWEMEVQLTPEK